MLGFSWDFVIALFISVALGYGFKDWKTGLYAMIWYMIIKFVWRFFTR